MRRQHKADKTVFRQIEKAKQQSPVNVKAKSKLNQNGRSSNKFLAGLSLRLITEKFLKHNNIKPGKSAFDLVY